MLPVQDDLVVQEPGALSVHYLLAEGLMLQELQEVQANRVFQVPEQVNYMCILENYFKTKQMRFFHLFQFPTIEPLLSNQNNKREGDFLPILEPAGKNVPAVLLIPLLYLIFT